jgi:CHASE2 domain-containing sensor protein
VIRYASRKFLLTLLIVLLATGLCAFALIDGGMWVTVVSLALTVYVGGNVAQKAVVKSAE